ncbi:MAG: hypothetical protein WB586_15510 [Chthoniobacterales bacterium]
MHPSQTPTQRDSEMGEIAADANALSKGVKFSAIRSSLLVIELHMAMDKVADGLNARPSRRYSSERFYGVEGQARSPIMLTAA